MEAPSCDRNLLRGFEIDIIKLVSKIAPRQLWAEWLRAPLECAAAKGNLDLFKALLGAGADGGVGWRGLGGRTFLGMAAEGGNEEVVQALLRAGATAEVDIQYGYDSRTALHAAAAVGAEGVARSLLSAGADPNLRDADGRRPIHVAAARGHHIIIGDLVKHGARINPRNDVGECALHVAIHMGHTLAVSTLLDIGANSNLKNLFGETPLYYAASYHRCDHNAERRVLSGAGTNLFRRHPQEGDPGLQQPSLRSLEMVHLLLQHEADITAVDGEGWGILHFHLQSYDFSRHRSGDLTSVARALLKAGAPVNAKIHSRGGSHDGLTPLHLAVDSGATNDIVLVLLQEGANVNCQDAKGRTPLHMACSHQLISSASLLLRWGADETLKDGEGKTAADSIYITDRNVDPVLRIIFEVLRRMLAAAPADRAWRRRRWLLLCRYFPNRARLTPCDSGRSGAGVEAKICSSHATGSPVKFKARIDAEGMTGGGGGVAREEGAAVEGMVGLQSLVKRVVGLDVEGVFRTVVGFL